MLDIRANDSTSSINTVLALEYYNERYNMCKAYATKISDTDIVVDNTITVNRKVYAWSNCKDVITLVNGNPIAMQRIDN